MIFIYFLICTLSATIDDSSDQYIEKEFQLSQEQIKNVEKQIDDKEIDDHKQKLLKFINWVFQHGVEANHISIDHTNIYNRIVKATQHIDQDERILLIPRKLLWISSEVKKNLLYSELLKNQDQLNYPSHTFIALQILYEKQNPISQWKEFLDILPERYDSFPIYYNESILDYLTGSYLLESLETQKKEIFNDYQTVLKYVPQFEFLSYEQYLEASIMTCSRVFSLNIDGVEVEALAPLADFFNYEKGYQTHWGFSQEDQAYFLVSEQEIEEDEEIFVNYGDKDNHIFLLNYGFINKEPTISTCFILFTLDANLPYINQKIDLIEKWYQKGLGAQFTFQVSNDLSNVIVGNFIDLVRYMLEPNLNVIDNYPVDDTVIYSKQNEQQVWAYIWQLSQQQKDHYKYKQSDVQNLIKNETDFNILNCLQILKEEYQVLDFFIDLAQDSIKILSSNPSQSDLEDYENKYDAYYQKIKHLFKKQNDEL